MADKMLRMAGRGDDGKAKALKADNEGNLGVQLTGSTTQLDVADSGAQTRLEAIENALKGNVNLATGEQTLPPAGERTHNFNESVIQGLKRIQVHLSLASNSSTSIKIQVDFKLGSSGRSIASKKVEYTNEELNQYAIEYKNFNDGTVTSRISLPAFSVEIPKATEIRVTLAQPTGTSYIASEYSIVGVR